MRRLFLFFVLLISGLAQAGTNPFETKPDFLPVGKAFVFTSERLESGETQLYLADRRWLLPVPATPEIRRIACRAQTRVACRVNPTATSSSANSRSIAKAWN